MQPSPWILAAIALLPFNALAGERGPDVPDYPADRITEQVYVIHGPLTTPNPDNQGFMNNPGIVLTAAGAVIIDPGASVQSGEMVLRAVAGLSDQPVVAVFNTHVHGDHWLGNQAIRAAWPQARIYAHPHMIAQVQYGAGQAWVELMEQLTDGMTRGTTVVAPDQAVSHGDRIAIGATTFRIHHYGPAHTDTDIMIEVVEPGVVFLGDNVLNGRIPRLDNGSIQGNVNACERILETGAAHYVPGHGDSGDRALVENMRGYFDTIDRNVRSLYEQGLADYEMKEDIRAQMQQFADWEEFDAQLGKHISYAWLAVEQESF